MITKMQIDNLGLITEHDGSDTHFFVTDDILAEFFPDEYNVDMNREQFFTLAKKHLQKNEPMIADTSRATIGEVVEE